MKKIKITMTTVMVFILVIVIVNKTLIHKYRNSKIPNRMYTYLKETSNRIQAFNDAISLNNNNSSNTCVYFVAEVLRKNGMQVAKETANTTQLIDILKDNGWRKDNDYEDLRAGDIVFTTDSFGNKNGTPTHVYVFMEWVNENSYDYAYICDNQAKDYNNKIYHIRNIKNREKMNGLIKDEFSFFMKP